MKKSSFGGIFLGNRSMIPFDFARNLTLRDFIYSQKENNEQRRTLADNNHFLMNLEGVMPKCLLNWRVKCWG